MEQRVNDFIDVMGMLRRRKWLMLLVAVGTFALGAAVVFYIPSMYRSKATILIETQDIPLAGQAGVTGYVEEHIQTISQRVMTRANLLRMIDDMGLYTAMRETATNDELVEKMKSDFTFTPIQAEIPDARLGRNSPMTIAFSLAYRGKDPQKVAGVAETITSLFLEENHRTRAKEAENTTAYLEKRQARLKEDIDGFETQIAGFKEKNLHSLPELMQLNLRNLDQLQDDVRTHQERIKQLKDRKVYLKGQLASVEPVDYSRGGNRPPTPEQKLRELRSHYLELKATLSDKHPDVINARNQLMALEASGASSGQYGAKLLELEDKQSKLDEARKRYTSRHPDVVRLSAEVAALNREVEEMESSFDPQQADEALRQENPAYIALETQIEVTSMEIASEEKLLEDEKAKLAVLEERIRRSPAVEQEYNALMRDYNNLEAEYKETLKRLQTARAAQGMEASLIGERLTVIEPPQVPEEPYKPNRMLLLLLAGMVAVGVGLGSGTLAELMDRSVRSASELGALTRLLVVGNVPYIKTRREVRAARMRVVATAVTLIVVTVVALGAVEYFYEPLGDVWTRLIDQVTRT